MEHEARRRADRSGSWQARPRWRIRRDAEIALGPGKADLLEEIHRAGSISGAGTALGMSYRRAWTLVATMNGCFTRPLVVTAAERRRGATLTPEGRRVLRLYRRIEAQSLRAVRVDLAELQKLLLRP